MEGFEEEMVRLAEEISLQEGNHYRFDPYDLGDTFDQIRSMEEVMDSIAIDSQDDDDKDRLTNEQLREIFFMSDGPNFAGSSQFDTYYNDSTGRPSSRGREKHIQDTVRVICQNLTWYRKKIVQEIEHSREVR